MPIINLTAVIPGRAIGAFTRVYSPSKTGVNALKDALWREPGIHTPRPWLWIPGSLTSFARRNNAENAP
jgi:hypothetical protein